MKPAFHINGISLMILASGLYYLRFAEEFSCLFAFLLALWDFFYILLKTSFDLICSKVFSDHEVRQIQKIPSVHCLATITVSPFIIRKPDAHRVITNTMCSLISPIILFF